MKRALILLGVVACQPASTPPSGASPTPTVELAPVDAASPSMGATPAVSANPPDATADVHATKAARTPVAGALFMYEEPSGDAISFVAPRTIVVQTSAGKTCSTELPAQGALSAAELTKAYGDPEVQKSLSGSAAYMSSAAEAVQGELRTSAGRITWTPFCGGLCTEGPKPIGALLHVLHALTVDRKKQCP